MRQAAFQIKGKPYIESAIAVGAPTRAILQRYILRPISGDLWVLLAAEISVVLFTFAQMAILGLFPGPEVKLGVPFGILRQQRFQRFTGYLPEWGQMLSEHLNMLALEPWLAMLPAFAFAISMLTFQLLAEGLRRSQRGVG